MKKLTLLLLSSVLSLSSMQRPPSVENHIETLERELETLEKHTKRLERELESLRALCKELNEKQKSYNKVCIELLKSNTEARTSRK